MMGLCWHREVVRRVVEAVRVSGSQGKSGGRIGLKALGLKGVKRLLVLGLIWWGVRLRLEDKSWALGRLKFGFKTRMLIGPYNLG